MSLSRSFAFDLHAKTQTQNIFLTVSIRYNTKRMYRLPFSNTIFRQSFVMSNFALTFGHLPFTSGSNNHHFGWLSHACLFGAASLSTLTVHDSHLHTTALVLSFISKSRAFPAFPHRLRLQFNLLFILFTSSFISVSGVFAHFTSDTFLSLSLSLSLSYLIFWYIMFDLFHKCPFGLKSVRLFRLLPTHFSFCACF
jgi:hypothetical protein